MAGSKAKPGQGGQGSKGSTKPEVAATASDPKASAKSSRMSKAAYHEQLVPLGLRLIDLARWLQHTGKRLVIVVEGRDTAGKGGVIASFTDTLNPRQCRAVALPKPTERERTQWYFQRYVTHLPAGGEIVLFDRSWYNRAGVEPVMGYCSPAEAAAFLKQAPVFEKLLVDDGILLFKYWLTVDQHFQEERFTERLQDPFKRWKLSPVDLEARTRYADYTQARHAMLRATHTPHAPWTLVNFNDQRRGRLQLIRHLLESLPEPVVPLAHIDFPPLPHAPLKERYTAKLRPI